MAQERITVQITDEDLIDLIPLYLENRHKDLEILKQAHTQNDLETVRSLGHKMKGSGGGYGLDRISEIGKELEEAAKVQNSDAIQNGIAALQDFLERIDIVS
jgi:HPt (histidine-containing phosphotransfer) domain-containing protein